MNVPNDGKQAVVLSSGAADGAYAVGVMKALLSGRSPACARAKPLNPEIFTGSSIGAFNAAFMVSQLEVDSATAVGRLEKIWLEELAENPQRCGNGAYRLRDDPRKLLDLRCIALHPVQSFTQLVEDSIFLAGDVFRRTTNFASSDESLLQRTLQLLNFSSFVSFEPFLRLIEKTIRFEDIRRSQTALRVAVTNWARGGTKFFSNQDLTDKLGPLIIQASGAIPGFFPPVLIDGEPHVDAAILGYARLHPAIDAGADTLHVIYNDPDVESIPNEELQSTLDILYRTFVITWAAQINRSVADVTRINGEIDHLEEAIRRTHLSATEAQCFLQAVLPPGRFRKRTGQERPEPFRVTVHRYHPRDDPYGTLGLLNLDRHRIEGLIARGFNDAVQHDCDASGCVLPKAAMPAAMMAEQR